MYCIQHFLHCMQYTIFLVWQLTCCSICAVKFVAVALIFFPCLMYGHMGYPLHLVIPGMFLFGLDGAKGGTFALIMCSFIFLGLLYAIRGGSLKTCCQTPGLGLGVDFNFA